MRIHGQRIDGAENVLRYIGAAHPVFSEPLDLFGRRDFPHQHQPEEPFRQRFPAIGRARQLLPQLRNGVAPETNAFFGIEQRRLPQHRSDVAHSTVHLVEHHVVHFFAAVFFQQVFDLLGEGL